MRVGIVGYGHLGKYLVDYIQSEGLTSGLVLDFVWNRTVSKLDELPKEVVLNKLEDITSRSVDLIVEVAHPGILKQHGEMFLSAANLFVGSPTALADAEVQDALRRACDAYKRSLFVPSGAFWGAQDILKMANLNTLSGLKVTMKKHPSAFRLIGKLKEANDRVLQDPSAKEAVTLYEGAVRELCPLAPNNVNTMAAAAIAAHNLGFDKVIGCLVADPSLLEWHIVEIEVKGKPTGSGATFEVKTVRKNPAKPGVVTGSATYGSFCNSLIMATKMQGPGLHMC